MCSFVGLSLEMAFIIAFLLLLERPLGESAVCTALGALYCFAVPHATLPAVCCTVSSADSQLAQP